MRARDQQVQARALELLERAARARASATPGAPAGADDRSGGRPRPWPDPMDADRAEGEPTEPRRTPVVEVPEGLRGAVARPSWPAVVGLALVLVLVAAVFSVRVVAARSAAAPVPVGSASRGTDATGGIPTSDGRPSASSSASSSVSSSVSSSTSSWPSSPGSATAGAPGAAGPGSVPGGTTARLVVVDVVGAVRRPGVQRLPVGSRVVDAVAAAGGSTPDADLAGVNRARPLVDGEQLRVPRVGEPAPAAPGVVPGTAAAGPVAGAPGGVGQSGAVGGATAGVAAPVDLNTADAAALDTLPGVGPAIAARILEWRAAHGRFTSVDELGEVSGIGDRLLERLRPLVRV